MALHKSHLKSSPSPAPIPWTSTAVLADLNPTYTCPTHGLITSPVYIYTEQHCPLGPYCFKCVTEIVQMLPEVKRIDRKKDK